MITVMLLTQTDFTITSDYTSADGKGERGKKKFYTHIHFGNVNIYDTWTAMRELFVTRSSSRLKNYSYRSVCASNVSLKRVIGIIVRMMPPRENDAPRRVVMITRMHILRDIGCRRNCPWNMLRGVWVYEYEMRAGRCTRPAQMRAWQTSCTHFRDAKSMQIMHGACDYT